MPDRRKAARIRCAGGAGRSASSRGCCSPCRKSGSRWPSCPVPAASGRRARTALGCGYPGIVRRPRQPHRGPEFALSVLEGVALSARQLFSSLTDAAGFRPDWLLYGGGGARSDLWSQIRADCLGVALHRFSYNDVGCLGAGIMAAVGVGAFSTIAEAVPAMTSVQTIFEPDPKRARRYDRMFEAYVKAIDALKPIGIIETDDPIR
nr:FGGY-family carbohydrate kinase [Marinicella sp. W31]MDC2880258.1 FGGY-family carbohydrate kinase [Marinicella sp. W31]